MERPLLWIWETDQNVFQTWTGIFLAANYSQHCLSIAQEKSTKHCLNLNVLKNPSSFTRIAMIKTWKSTAFNSWAEDFWLQAFSEWHPMCLWTTTTLWMKYLYKRSQTTTQQLINTLRIKNRWTLIRTRQLCWGAYFTQNVYPVAIRWIHSPLITSRLELQCLVSKKVFRGSRSIVNLPPDKIYIEGHRKFHCKKKESSALVSHCIPQLLPTWELSHKRSKHFRSILEKLYQHLHWQHSTHHTSDTIQIRNHGWTDRYVKCCVPAPMHSDLAVRWRWSCKILATVCKKAKQRYKQ